MKKMLVTGGCGFIGSAFIRYVLQSSNNFEILNLDILNYAANLENLKQFENHPNYKFVKGDIRDEQLVEKLFEREKFNFVINFAAQTHVDNSIKNPKDFIETNINGTFCLLEAAKKFQIEKFLQISTDEVYGALPETGSFTEKSPICPTSPYSASKASADLLCMAYFKTFKLPVLITRTCNNFGPCQHEEKLIPLFIKKLLKNEKVPLYGSGKQVRDWIFVEENAKALYLVLEHGKPGEVYNIGANCEKSNLEITNILLKKLKKSKHLISHVQDRPAHDFRYAIDASKIKKELGFEPKVSFDEAIEKTIQYYIKKF